MEPRKQNKMAVMPMKQLVFNMSLPLMISLLVQSLYNIVDGIFVARLSQDALTATSLAYPVQLLMIAVSVGTGVGVNALLSRLLGAREREAVGSAATTGMILAFFWTVVFMILGLTCSGVLARSFTEDTQTAELCRQYLSICMIFCLGIFVETLAQRLLQAAGNTGLSMISLVVGAGTNIILDPIMIFGCFGCPALGIRGAAIATVIGQWLGALVALLLHQFLNPEVRFRIRGYRFDFSIVKKIYKVGAPTILTQAMGSIMLTCINKILIEFGSTYVAFFGVYYKLQNFLMMPMNGLGQAAIPIAGFNYGAKNGKRIRELLRTAIPAAVAIGLIGTLVFLAIPGTLLGLFSASDEMLAIGIPALRVISLTFPFAAATIVIGYSISGLGNGVVNMLGTGLRQVILFIPLAWIFSRIGGAGMTFYAIWISELTAAAYAALSLKKEYKKKIAPFVSLEDV